MKTILRFLLSWFLRLAIPFFLVTGVLNYYMIHKTSDRIYHTIEEVPQHEYGLLLGTSWKMSSGRDSKFFHHRVDAAEALLKAGKVQKLIVSGTTDRQYYDEVKKIYHYLQERGIPDSILIPDPNGSRTIYSIKNLRSPFGVRKCLIISQEFHLYRAIFLCDFYDIAADGFAAAPADFWDNMYMNGREYLARVKAWIDLALGG